MLQSTNQNDKFDSPVACKICFALYFILFLQQGETTGVICCGSRDQLGYLGYEAFRDGHWVGVALLQIMEEIPEIKRKAQRLVTTLSAGSLLGVVLAGRLRHFHEFKQAVSTCTQRNPKGNQRMAAVVGGIVS